MTTRPHVVIFDVNETLTDMEPLRARFEDVGPRASCAVRACSTWSRPRST